MCSFVLMARSLVRLQPIVYAGWFMPEAHKDALPELQEKMSINVRNDLNYLENTLKENTKSGYIFGNDITFADIMVAFSAHYVLALEKGAKWNDDTYPHVKDWIRRLRKREGWQRAVSKGEDSYTFDANTP
jgi:glutathione S-transferase